MSLEAQIKEFQASFLDKIPEDTLQTMLGATQSLADSGITQKTPKNGDTLLNFSLPDQNLQKQELSTLLEYGPVVVTFYRGGWCPYCNLELRAYQKILADINAMGATLVAITPEVPDASMTTIEKNELQFKVLSDVNSEYAREIGMVFSLPEELRPIYTSLGIHLDQHGGSKPFDLPLAATFVIAQDGKIANSFVDADYTKRMEPEQVLSALKALKS